jgi:hypothetical protein
MLRYGVTSQMNPTPDLQGLIGTPLMSAINALSAMGFRCRDISRGAVRPSLEIAGMLHCTKHGSGSNSQSLSIILPFSNEGIILDVIPPESDDPA